MTGTTKIDFAGTLEEAKSFAAEHRSKFPKTFNVWRGEQFSPNGDTIIHAAWVNREQRLTVRRVLASLGWDEGSQAEFEHRSTRK